MKRFLGFATLGEIAPVRLVESAMKAAGEQLFESSWRNLLTC